MLNMQRAYYNMHTHPPIGAQINIADRKGTIYDIRNTGATHGKDEALVRARSIGAKGRKAASIGVLAEDNLFNSFVNETITAEQTEQTVRAAT